MSQQKPKERKKTQPDKNGPLEIFLKFFVVFGLFFHKFFIPSSKKNSIHNKFAWFASSFFVLFALWWGFFAYDVVRSKPTVTVYVDTITPFHSKSTTTVYFYRVKTDKGLFEVRNKKRFLIFRAGDLQAKLFEKCYHTIQYAPRTWILWRRYPIILANLKKGKCVWKGGPRRKRYIP